MVRVLVVEDNKEILSNITLFLETREYVVDCADNAMTAMHLISNNPYDVVVLDIMLPGGASGYDICRNMRQLDNQIPVIMLTAKDSIEERLQGFDAGADDYLIKPFSLDELEARISAVYKRSVGGGKNTLKVGELTFNTDTFEVTRAGQAIELHPTLYKLLEVLMRHSPNVIRKEALEAAVWGDDLPESNVLKTTVHMLRKKIDGPFDDEMLHTMRGIGYYIK